MIVKMLLADAAIGDEQALRAEPQPDAFGDAGERRGKRRADSAVENPQRAQALPAQQRDEPDQIDAALQFRSEMLEIKRRRDGRLGLEQFAAPLDGGTKNFTWPPGAVAAMARMNGRCQMTSPIPGLTRMTAL